MPRRTVVGPDAAPFCSPNHFYPRELRLDGRIFTTLTTISADAMLHQSSMVSKQHCSQVFAWSPVHPMQTSRPRRTLHVDLLQGIECIVSRLKWWVGADFSRYQACPSAHSVRHLAKVRRSLSAF
jgi:hypothetical protein